MRHTSLIFLDIHKVCLAVSQDIGLPVCEVDLSAPISIKTAEDDDSLLSVIPVYDGQVPTIALEQLTQIKDKDDSNSVKNQRDLLGDFYQRHMDKFESAVGYVDNGHTGTDIKGPKYKHRLMSPEGKDTACARACGCILYAEAVGFRAQSTGSIFPGITPTVNMQKLCQAKGSSFSLTQFLYFVT